MSDSKLKEIHHRVGLVNANHLANLVEGEVDKITLQLSDMDLNKGNVGFLQLNIVEIDRVNNKIITPSVTDNINLSLPFTAITLNNEIGSTIEVGTKTITDFQHSCVSCFGKMLSSLNNVSEEVVEELFIEPLLIRNQIHPLFSNCSIILFPVEGREYDLQGINCLFEIERGGLNKLGYSDDRLVEIDINDKTPLKDESDQDIRDVLLEDIKVTVSKLILKANL